MLYQLGNVQFEVAPLNPVEISSQGEASFAEKAVVGRRPGLEFVGEGPESVVIRAKLFPERFGGLSSLSALHTQRKSGKAFPFVRGDGAALGWHVITMISETSSYLGERGVGRVVEIDIQLQRTDQQGGLGSLLELVF